MKRHNWFMATPVVEQCRICGASRIAGYWHHLKRPSRRGETRKWRVPGHIRNGSALCPGTR